MSEKQLVNLAPGTTATNFIDSLDAILENIRKKVPVHDKNLTKKSDRQEIISDAFAVRKSKTFLASTIDSYIAEQKKKIEPITNVIEQLKQSKKKSDKTLSALAEETRLFVTEWETEQKRIADEEAARVAAEELAAKVEDDHEMGLLLADKFDRELLEALAEEMRIEKAHVARIAEEAAAVARIEAETKAKAEIERVEREKRELVEREQIAKEQAEQSKRNLIAAEERAKVQAEQTETARFDAERQAVINAKNAAKQAKAAEIARQEAEKAASEKADAERLANREHVANVLGEIKLSIIGLGATEELAKSITLALYKNNIPHSTIKF